MKNERFPRPPSTGSERCQTKRIPYLEAQERLSVTAAHFVVTGPIIGFMSPALFTPEKQCYSVLILQFFRKADIKAR